ncbi:MAG: prolyl oligopeptidase family serine peptidase, partial [Acidimicrobiales bacterium]
ALWAAWRSRLAGRDRLRERIDALTPGAVGPPQAAGDRLFFSRRQPGHDHAVYLVVEPDGRERVLIDPNALGADGTVTLDVAVASKEGRLVAYQLSAGGDEMSTLHVLDVGTGRAVDGPIALGRAGPVAWLPGGAEFYYVRRAAEAPEGEEQFHRRVWHRRIGQPPEADTLVFGEGLDPIAYFGVGTSLDGRWLMVSVALGTAPRNDLYLADRHGDGRLGPVQQGVDAQTFGRVHHDGRLYLYTNRDAPRWRLCIADPTQPRGGWLDLLPETDALLTGYAVTDDAVVAVRARHAVSEVTVHDRATGAALGVVALPGLGSAGVVGRPGGGGDVWVTYTDHLSPQRVLRYHVPTGELAPWA